MRIQNRLVLVMILSSTTLAQTLRFFIDDTEATQAYINCDQHPPYRCTIINQNFAINSRFMIQLDGAFQVETLVFKNVLISRDNINTVPIIDIQIPILNIRFESCSLKNIKLRIKASNVEFVFTSIHFTDLIIIASDKIDITSMDTTILDSTCSYRGGIASNPLLMNFISVWGSDKFDCSMATSPQNIGSAYFEKEFESIKNPHYKKSVFMLTAKSVKISDTSRIEGNTIIAAQNIELLRSSEISSTRSGCKYEESDGFPLVFISHSFDCGLNAGSYGGRGGVGLGKNIKDSLECIKNGLPRMMSYGNPLNPILSGSAGNPESSNSIMDPSPGYIILLFDSIIIEKSTSVSSGISEVSLALNKKPKSSGGSIYMAGKSFNIKGKIRAEGQSSLNYINGEGGGGRVYFHSVCWYDESIYKNIKEPDNEFNKSRQMKSALNFERIVISVKAGDRNTEDIQTFGLEKLSKIQSLIQAENGSKQYFNEQLLLILHANLDLRE